MLRHGRAWKCERRPSGTGMPRGSFIIHGEKTMRDLPYYTLSELEAAGRTTGYDALSIMVWIMFEYRGCSASKFAAECIGGNHEPWVVAEKLRWVMAKYFTPE